MQNSNISPKEKRYKVNIYARKSNDLLQSAELTAFSKLDALSIIVKNLFQENHFIDDCSTFDKGVAAMSGLGYIIDIFSIVKE